MKNLPSLLSLTVPLMLSVIPADVACADTPAPSPAVTTAAEFRDETILLVSLEDGSVIKQLIDIDADICFKQNTSSSTMCLTQGDPIFDPVTNAVIGFEMIENHIELVAKND